MIPAEFRIGRNSGQSYSRTQFFRKLVGPLSCFTATFVEYFSQNSQLETGMEK